MLLLASAHPEPGSASKLAQAEPRPIFRLADTLGTEGWRLSAGRVGMPADIVSSAQASYIVDSGHRALHVLDDQDRPSRVFPAPADQRPLRAALGEDAHLRVLLQSAEGWAIWELDADRPIRVLPLEMLVGIDAYVDLTVTGSGDLLLLGQHALSEPRPVLDRFGPDGRFLGRSGLRDLFLPGCEELGADRLAVDAAGDVHLAIEARLEHCPDPAAPRPDPGDPRPPVVSGHAKLRLIPTPRVERVTPGPVPDDLSIGAAGGIVAAGAQVLPLEGGLPLAELPSTTELGMQPMDAPALPSMSVSLGIDGRVRAVSDRCPSIGAWRWEPGQAIDRARSLVALDLPRDASMGLPWRLERSGEALLSLALPSDSTDRPSGAGLALDRWDAAGRHQERRWICQDPGSAAALPSLAASADAVYLETGSGSLERWTPGEPGPTWRLRERLGRGAELALRENGPTIEIARLNLLESRTERLDASAQVSASWAYTDAERLPLPVDLAWSGDRLLLASQGRRVIEARSADGRFISEIKSHLSPGRVATAADRRYALTREGWVLRYAAGGALTAAWPLPLSAGMVASDIAVDVGDSAADDQVFISFARFAPVSADRDFSDAPLLDAGIWRFESSSEAPALAQTPADESCALFGDSQVAASILPIDGELSVSLQLDGRCPGVQAAQHLVMALETRGRMAEDGRLQQAQALLSALVGGLRSGDTWLSLLAPGQELPLDPNLDARRAAIWRQVAEPLAQADPASLVRRASALLAAPPALPNARRTMVLALDGQLSEADAGQLATALNELESLGGDAILLVLGGRELGAEARARLQALPIESSALFIDLPVARVEDLAAAATGWDGDLSWLESGTLVERIAPGWRYRPDSAEPPATWDPANRSLTWQLPADTRDDLVFRYWLQPERMGRMPISLGAGADLIDGYGQPSTLDLPVPEVEVVEPPRPEPLRPLYLPYLPRLACKPSQIPLDILLILDSSSSMSEPALDGRGSKLEAAQRAALAFLEQLRLPPDQVGILSFDGAARRHLGLSDDSEAVRSALASLKTGSGTRIDLGLMEAERLLLAQGRREARAVAILLTDGLHAGSGQDVTSAAAALKAAGAIVYTIGLGDDPDEVMLRRVASSPERFFRSPSAAELEAIYREILAYIDCER